MSQALVFIFVYDLFEFITRIGPLEAVQSILNDGELLFFPTPLDEVHIFEKKETLDAAT